MRNRVVLLAVAILSGSGLVAAHGAPIDPPAGPQIGGLPLPWPTISQSDPSVPGVTVGPARSGPPAVLGQFSAPFVEPGKDCPHVNGTTETCKPAGVTVAVLPNGKILYFDGLEGEEKVNLNVVAEFGDKAIDDQSRVLSGATTAHPSWSTPKPPTGGANGSDYTDYIVPGAPAPLDGVLNDPGVSLGALFCSDVVFMADGRLLTPGGTHYYEEPHAPGTTFGVSELEGLRDTRIFDPTTQTWSASGRMNHGRWYPSLVTLPNGKVFVASGVTKLLKPLYPNAPADSGTNVRQTETFDPHTGKWTDNPASADKSLPLYPRLHLLPDGRIYYDAAGQVFNPMGEAYDEALWNYASVYDPAKQTWKNVGIPLHLGFDTDSMFPTLSAGFRGSAFSLMLPLKPPYTSASFLSAGGVLGVTPGGYFGTTASQINTIDTSNNDAFSSMPTGPLNNARWFSAGVVLPTGQVLTFNGANRDEVLGPGSGFPVKQVELFDPATSTWTPLASSIDPRVYHNSAVLLPSGEVLVGGNAPISNTYFYNQTFPGGFSPGFRDPSFEIYRPPYLFWGSRPTILSAPTKLDYGGGSFVVGTHDAVESVTLVRNTAYTHLIDGDQRTVQLSVQSHDHNGIRVANPANGAVVPPGPYLLFINTRTAKGLVPSVAAQVLVG